LSSIVLYALDFNIVVSAARRPAASWDGLADLARGLGFAVVGEGVDSAWSYGYLRDIGCHEAQGFYLSKPVTAGDLAAWLDG
jgi:EAL domain-containing protein (putative c-di-GMP-specific phosphodiesterase class I)